MPVSPVNSLLCYISTPFGDLTLAQYLNVVAGGEPEALRFLRLFREVLDENGVSYSLSQVCLILRNHFTEATCLATLVRLITSGYIVVFPVNGVALVRVDRW